MKVDSTTHSGLQTLKDGLQRTQQGEIAATGGAGTSASTTSTASGASSGDANVNLSGLSSQLQNIASAGTSDIDTTHVESIKQAIKDGTLTIDSSKIADGVLATARELLQKNGPSAGN